MFRNFLVLIPTERPVGAVIDLAVSVSKVRGAHLDGVAIGYASMTSAGYVVEGGAAVAAVMEVERGRALERADNAISVFKIEARLANISCGTRGVAVIPFEAAQTMAALARLYDLTIVLQPDPSSSSRDNVIPQAVLFNSGGPMLMVPHTHKGAFDGRNVGICWDGSRLAARALRDGRPFLKAAETVTVIAVNEDQHDPSEASANDIVAHLARGGIKARIERLSAGRRNVHDTILSSVADNDIGLLVMGGYGHSRLQERILGGVTRGMFDSMTVPVLMSH